MRPRTVQTYLGSLAAFDRFLGEQGLPTEAGSIRREHVEAFMSDLLQRAKPSTASVRYRALQQSWRWALSDDLIVASPMAKLRPPGSWSTRRPCSPRTSCGACCGPVMVPTSATAATLP